MPAGPGAPELPGWPDVGHGAAIRRWGGSSFHCGSHASMLSSRRSASKTCRMPVYYPILRISRMSAACCRSRVVNHAAKAGPPACGALHGKGFEDPPLAVYSVQHCRHRVIQPLGVERVVNALPSKELDPQGRTYSKVFAVGAAQYHMHITGTTKTRPMQLRRTAAWLPYQAVRHRSVEL